MNENNGNAAALVALLNEFSERLGQFPPVTWEQVIDAATDTQKGEIDDCADGLAQRLARLGTYASYRNMMTGHKNAVKQQNRVAAGVRKALGHSYPKQEINF